jgi:hypothetical protein
MFSSTSDGGNSLEDPRMHGGVFTRYLLRGLSGQDAEKKDSNVRLLELTQFVTSRVKVATALTQSPVFVTSSTGDDPFIVGERAIYSKIVVIAIGNSEYTDRSIALRFAASDASDFAQFWQGQAAHNEKISTKVVINGTRAQTLEALGWSKRNADSDSLEILYYSGHALTERDGTSWLLPVDADRNDLRMTGVSTAEVRSALSESPARTKIIFIDAAFTRPESSR